MKYIKKPYVWAVSYTVLLVLFTAYVVLDTFVIPRAYVVLNTTEQTQTLNSGSDGGSYSPGTTDAPADSQASDSGDTASTNSAVTTEHSYSDDNISITVNEYREYDTSIYVADIVLSDIDYLQTAFAQNTFGKNITEKTSAIASDNSAILAINGDYYGAQNRGFVIRNGTVYRNTVSGSSQEDLVIYSDGSFSIITEGAATAAELLVNGAVHVLSFGPSLLNNGSVTVSETDEVDKAMASNPRTAIGIIEDLHYVMVVSDGRTSASTGLTLRQLAAFMQDLGVRTAYNLDGGGSSTMVFNNSVVNNPTTNGKRINEREVSDIVYIGY